MPMLTRLSDGDVELLVPWLRRPEEEWSVGKKAQSRRAGACAEILLSLAHDHERRALFFVGDGGVVDRDRVSIRHESL